MYPLKMCLYFSSIVSDERLILNWQTPGLIYLYCISGTETTMLPEICEESYSSTYARGGPGISYSLRPNQANKQIIRRCCFDSLPRESVYQQDNTS